MTPEQARGMLMSVVGNGRIILNGAPLTAVELGQLQQAVVLLYDRAKEKEEKEQERKREKENENGLKDIVE